MLGKYDKNTFDLDLDPMTFILELDPDMVKIYLYTKSEVPKYSNSKLLPEQTDTQTWVKLLPTHNMRMVK